MSKFFMIVDFKDCVLRLKLTLKMGIKLPYIFNLILWNQFTITIVSVRNCRSQRLENTEHKNSNLEILFMQYLLY